MILESELRFEGEVEAESVVSIFEEEIGKEGEDVYMVGQHFWVVRGMGKYPFNWWFGSLS